IKTHIEKRSRVGPRPQIAANADTPFEKHIAAQSEISRPPQRQIISFRDPKSFFPGSAESRRQKTRSAVLVLQRKRGKGQIDHREVLKAESRRTETRA